MKVREIIAENSVWVPNPAATEERPIVSVLLPTFSRARDGYLNRCIDSVLNQSFRSLELIIVIDGSTDGTFDICREYQEKDSRVHLIWHKRNMGLPAISTYEAYMKARGDYMAYAFDDNEWALDAIGDTVSFMEENGVRASYGITTATDPVSGKLFRFGEDEEIVNGTIWSRNCIGAGAVVLHRSVLETVGLHDPHLSLTRNCDWDLWRRVRDRFRFAATGVPFAFEKGTMLDDSLGNTFKMDQWFFRERQQHRDLSVLLPENYLDADVTEWSTANSRHFLQCLQEFENQYKEKYWFRSDEAKEIDLQKANLWCKRIMVVCHHLTASIMNFTRYCGERFTFAFVYFSESPIDILSFADAVVFCRSIPDISMMTAMALPCYYFTDDNFCEIAKDSDDPGVKTIADCTTKEGLKRFEGVIVTTPAFRDYFIKNELHDHVMILPPVYRETAPKKTAHIGNMVTVGFMGGRFRMETLETCVLPALCKLAERYSIRLVCPCTKENVDAVAELGNGKIEVIPFIRSLDYEYVINSYSQIGIDVLIHCGENGRNNIFKTKNALINAASLHAPLLVSDIEPYSDLSDGAEGAYCLVQNTPEAWENELQRLFDDAEYRKSIEERGEAFCRDSYSSEAAWRELEAYFQEKPPAEDYHYIRRLEKLFLYLVQHSTGTVMKRRVYIPEKLAYSCEIQFPRRYGFTPKCKRFGSVGLLFAVTGHCAGTVKLRFFRKNEKEAISTVEFPIDSIREEQYTDILLTKPVAAEPDELLYMEIDVDYAEKNGYVGLFEDSERRTFFYKVFNKLGYPIPGKDALFIDCYE